MFSGDNNLFYSHRNVQNFFETANEALDHIEKWFIANKLSLNTKKTEYTFFHETLYEITYHLNYVSQTFLINQLKGQIP